MTDQERVEELLTFFKALSDENRLKIVGLEPGTELIGPDRYRTGPKPV